MGNPMTTVAGDSSLTAGQVFRGSLREHWGLYLSGSLSLVLTSTTEIAAPKFIQWSIDVLTGTKAGKAEVPGVFTGASQVETLNSLVIWLLVSLLVGWLGRFIWRQTLARRSHQAARDLKIGLWRNLRLQPLQTFQKYSLGDLMNRATGDLNAGRSIHGFTIVLTYDMVFLTILGSTAMLLIDWQLALYCLLCFPLLPRFVVKLARREYTQHIWAQEKLSALSDLVAQSLTSIRLQRATASEGMWQRALEAEAKDYADRRFEVLHTGLKMFPLGALPILLAYAILLVLGVRKIQEGSLTAGEFVALQSYVMILQIPLLEMGDVISEWQRGFASLNRIVEIFNLGKKSGASLRTEARDAAHPEVETRDQSSEAGPVARVVGLTIVLPGMQSPVLAGINLDIPAGARLGICGPIGSGKSTLLSVLAGLADVPSGVVFIGGQDISRVSRSFLTSQVAMVPQKAFLFAGSIRYNLCLNLNDGSVTDNDLWNVLELVGLAGEVTAFKEGLDTWIGEWGINLSGGQKQRLALARALLRPRPLLLLDDCLSAVDAVTEEKILTGLSEKFAGRTVVWVAHRPSTLRLCTSVYHLEAGKIRPASYLDRGVP